MISLSKDTDYKRYVIQYAIIFCVMMIVGLFVGMNLPHETSSVAANYVFNQSASAKLIDVSNNPLYRSVAFFFNNTLVGFIFAIAIPFITLWRSENIEKDSKRMVFFSRLIFGAQMFIIFVAVGYIAPHITIAKFVAALVPHGIFEIPAIIMSAALGIWYILHQYNKLTFKNLCSIFGYYMVPLFAIAAVIESFITPVIMKMVS